MTFGIKNELMLLDSVCTISAGPSKDEANTRDALPSNLIYIHIHNYVIIPEELIPSTYNMYLLLIYYRADKR